MESFTSLPIKPILYDHPPGIPRARPLRSGIVSELGICLTSPMTLLKLNKVPLPSKHPVIRPQFTRTGSATSLVLELWVFLFEDGSSGSSSSLFTLPNVFLVFTLDFIKFLNR